jgi:hypothetical protein
MLLPMTPRHREDRGRWLRLLWAGVLCGLVLAGCATSLVYPRLDTLLGFYIRGLVTLENEQSLQLSRTLERNLDWHRRDELRRYDAWMRDLARSIAAGLDRPALDTAVDEAEMHGRRLLAQLAPGYIELAATLTDRQVRELLENLEREDEKTWLEHSQRTSADRFEARERAVRRHVERFTGPLTVTQREIVRDYAWNARPFMFEWRENRRRWREELAATLPLRAAPGEAYTTRMHVLLAEPDRLWTPEYRTALATSRAELLDLLLELDATLSPKQRARAERRLLELAGELRDLAQRGGEAQNHDS